MWRGPPSVVYVVCDASTVDTDLCTGAYTAMTVFVLGPALQGLLFVLVPVLQGPPKSEPKAPAADFVPNIFSRPVSPRPSKKMELFCWPVLQ